MHRPIRGIREHSRRESQQDPLLSRSSSPAASRPMSPMSYSSVPSSSSLSTPQKRMGPSASSSFNSTAASAPGRSSLNPRSNYTSSGLAPGFADDDDIDDPLHTFTAADRKTLASPFDLASWRGWANALTLVVLLAAVVMLFGGYPIIAYYGNKHASFGGSTSGYNLGGVNASGQYPDLPNYPRLIDPDTPKDAYTHAGEDGKTWNLVFSDEFEQDDRSFWDGDDPFFQGVDLHYWGTNDFEYYHPSAITTKGGHLVITMNQEPIGGLNLKSGMLQSWNKLCFNKNAYVEASISLPGNSYTGGFWPGAWMFANLGRPGYGATTDGGWPYSYDSCDIGTLPNQTWPNGTGPDAALTTGQDGGTLSYLPGQRYSACTCPGEDHPGPSNDIGRGIPEVDIIEAQIQIENRHGEVSQTYQIAPYDPEWKFDNSSGNEVNYDKSIVHPNTYFGGVYQQSCSRLVTIEDDTYVDQDGVGVVSDTAGQFKAFGVEFMSNAQKRDEGYIQWVSEGKKSWKLLANGLGPNSETEVGRRLIPEEPMALVFNFGASNNFQNVDWVNLQIPNVMRIDYVRVYQNDDGTVGCDPDDHPTAKYIEKHSNAYNNPNLTTWQQAGNTFPKNRLVDQC